jgi:hypothetical protein
MSSQSNSPSPARDNLFARFIYASMWKTCLDASFVIALLLATLAPSIATATSVTVDGYSLQLLTDPDPPTAGQKTLITLKIIRLTDGAPAQNGKILIMVSETQDTAKTSIINSASLSDYVEAIESDTFGNYELRALFASQAIHTISIVISEIEGRKLLSPLKVTFTVIVDPPDRGALRLWLVFFTVIALTIGFVHVFYLKSQQLSTQAKDFNLLDIPWLKKMLTWKYLQPLFQVPLLVMFIVLLFLAFFDIQDGGKNLSTKLIWTIWWAGVIFTFVLVGRMWCFMCPLGAATEWISKLVKATRRFPASLRNIWIANLLFITLTWVDLILGIVGIPMLTGVLFIVISLFALSTALLYERRTFCRYLCPIGGIIGIYSMFSAVELRSKDCEVCRKHTQKECYTGSAKGRGCPMFEIVPQMDSNNACNFCGACINTCSRNNITLRFRMFFKDAWTTSRQSLDEASLAVVLVGVSIFVTGDMLEPWEGWMSTAKTMVPADLLGLDYDYTIEAVAKSFLYLTFSLIVIPGVMLLAAALSNHLAGPQNHKGVLKTFTIFGYMFIPIGLSMHLAHNTGHLLNESGGIVPAVQRAVNIYTPFNAGEPNWLLASEPFVGPVSLYWLQMGLLLVFYVFSLYAGHKLSLKNYKNGRIAFRALLPMVVLSFALIMVNVFLLNLPMAPRHIH